MAIHSGSWYGLPDLGISEAIGSVFNRPTTYQGGSNLIGAMPSPMASSGQVLGNNTGAFIGPVYSGPQGAVQGPTYYGPQGTGSTGGGAPVQTQTYQQPNNIPLQSAPQNTGEQVDWNAMYNPAFSALSQYEGTLQPQYQTTLNEIEQGMAQKKAGAQQQLAEKEGQYNLNRQTETGRTKSTVAEARRLASEMMQGIQAKFGGSTSAGGAYSEILGSQATRNISQQQAALQQALSQIGQEESNVRNQTTQYITQLEQNSQLEKEKARNQLQQSLAQVAQMRGTLESEKASQKIKLLQDYNNQLAQIDQANTQFKQNLYTSWQQQQYQLDQLKAKTVNQYSADLTGFTPQNFDIGGTSYAAVPKSSNIMYLKGGDNTDENNLDWTSGLTQ